MCDGMEWEHVVEWGDHVSRIAEAHNISAWETLWDANAASLKRMNPNQLYPGQVVQIPQPEDQLENEGTEAEHEHNVDPPALYLRLRVLNTDYTPLAKASYKLYCTGMTDVSAGKTTNSVNGTTDDLGQIDLSDVGGKEYTIPADAKDATLTVQLPAPSGQSSGTLTSSSYCTWKLLIGYLPPIQEDAPDTACVPGVQMRLHNLGFYDVMEDLQGITETLADDVKEAITTFQQAYGMTENGSSDSSLQTKLEEVHDLKWTKAIEASGLSSK